MMKAKRGAVPRAGCVEMLASWKINMGDERNTPTAWRLQYRHRSKESGPPTAGKCCLPVFAGAVWCVAFLYVNLKTKGDHEAGGGAAGPTHLTVSPGSQPIEASLQKPAYRSQPGLSRAPPDAGAAHGSPAHTSA